MATKTTTQKTAKGVQTMEEVAIRFAGDSGDGMQLAGTQFTTASAVFGNDISTFPDYPAEIRAPAGSLAGVSGFQVNFSSHDIHTPGDRVNALVAFNPAALRTNVGDVLDGGIVIINEDAFDKGRLKQAGYDTNPLEDGTLSSYQLYRVPVSKLTREALKDSSLGAKQIDRCKNIFALGVVCWLYGRSIEPTTRWISQKFGKIPDVADANITALKSGYYYGENCDFFANQFVVDKAALPPGTYRKIGGNEALALGLIAAAELAGKQLFYGSYPITPASDVLHALARRKNFGVKTFQAEDEIAAMGSVIGAAFAGDLAVTGTSGPGLALKMEAIGLGVMTELPAVIIDVQRGGPSTGLPTKTEQSDLLQAIQGRNGECPVCVLAANSPSDCFDVAIEACRIAMKFMTPVILLSDGYVANGEEPWRIPDVASLPKLKVVHPSANGQSFMPYERNAELARPWAIPGTPGLEHRIGGLEKKDITGEVCYDPDNHERMIRLRAKKIASIALDVPEQDVMGPDTGDLLVLGWGGTAGAIRSAVERVQKSGHAVAAAHLRYLNPLPRNLADILRRYDKILIAELNMGQLQRVIHAEYKVDTIGFHKVKGKPFLISEVEAAIMDALAQGAGK